MRQTCFRLAALSLAISSLVMTAPDASAARRTAARAHHGHARSTTHHHALRTAYAHYGHVIQCVAFVQAASDVMLHGNARDWWYNARGLYARGQQPSAGSVLAFRPTRRMPLGHVALVTGIENSRTIIIDQSHWAQRGISRNIHVVDVSPNNDWSAVRVALNGHPDSYGSIYPTHGFIYPHRDPTDENAPAVLAKAGSVAVPSALQHPMASTEVAEAPDDAFAVDAPDRRIR